MSELSTPKTVLIVDDDHSINAIFEFILQQAGYKTLTASSGKECLSVLATNQAVDLIFLDLKMPELSGIETLKRIQVTRPDQLVIMMTGYTVDDLLKEAFELGVYGVIYKPFDIEEVLSVIKRVFKEEPKAKPTN